MIRVRPSKLRALWTDPRFEVAAALAFVIAVVATPIGSWPLFATESWLLAVVIGLTGIPVNALSRRAIPLALISTTLAILMAGSHPAAASLGVWNVGASLAAKSILAITAVLTLALGSQHDRLLNGLSGLGMPAALTNTLFFMIRYLHILGDERDRMMQARRARSFGRRCASWRSLAQLLAALMSRAVERGDRVYAAMQARGWDGTRRSLQHARKVGR